MKTSVAASILILISAGTAASKTFTPCEAIDLNKDTRGTVIGWIEGSDPDDVTIGNGTICWVSLGPEKNLPKACKEGARVKATGTIIAGGELYTEVVDAEVLCAP